MDARLRERRFLLPPFFALRLADRLAAFLLPPFLAEAFLREERLLGAMVPTTGDYEYETNLRTTSTGGTKHNNPIQEGITTRCLEKQKTRVAPDSPLVGYP